jgi:putative transposase
VHDGDLSEFLRWLTVTHTQRYHAPYHTAGNGPVYQGRFKSFPIQEDDHTLTVLRCVERNALRASMVARAEEWRWSSLWWRAQGRGAGLVDDGPVSLPASWLKYVNGPETEAELEGLRRSVRPFGDHSWVQGTAKCLGLEATLRQQGRPRKASAQDAQ